MIAIVTSTLFPSNKPIFEGKRSAYDPGERAEQTRETVLSLRNAGFSDIYLLDNSEKQFHQNVHSMFGDVNVLTFDNYQFNNRGISEVLLILNSLKHLPDNAAILKISGRYRLNSFFNKPIKMESDFIGKGFDYPKKNGTVSTRCYLTLNKKILEQIMLKTLILMNAFPFQMVGPRSFLKAVQRKLVPFIPEETTMSIEMAVARVLKSGGLSIQLVEPLGLEGLVAGAGTKREFLSE